MITDRGVMVLTEGGVWWLLRGGCGKVDGRKMEDNFGCWREGEVAGMIGLWYTMRKRDEIRCGYGGASFGRRFWLARLRVKTFREKNERSFLKVTLFFRESRHKCQPLPRKVLSSFCFFFV